MIRASTENKNIQANVTERKTECHGKFTRA